jgi:hypothetical protein
MTKLVHVRTLERTGMMSWDGTVARLQQVEGDEQEERVQLWAATAESVGWLR